MTRTARRVKCVSHVVAEFVRVTGNDDLDAVEREAGRLEQVGHRARVRGEQRRREFDESLGDDERLDVTGAQRETRERATRDGVTRRRRAVEDLLWTARAGR